MEDVVALYELGQHENWLAPRYDIRRTESSGLRIYFKDEEKKADKIYVYSATTILNVVDKGIGFQKWLGNSNSYESAMEYAHYRAWIGTVVHNMTNHLLVGAEVNCGTGFFNEFTNSIEPIPDEVKARIEGFINFYEEKKPKMIANELMLYNPKKFKGEVQYPYGGQLDLLCYIGDKLWIIDIKTGKEYPKTQALQQTAYKILVESLYPDIKVDKIGCLYLTATGNYKLKALKFVPEVWLDTVSMFKYMYSNASGNMPKIREYKPKPSKYRIEELYNLYGKDRK